jgi:endonuclease/exonuclease/phosphatase family metal-dependent hydrolase
MTRNLYVGADITAPLRAVAGRSGPVAIDALGRATHDVLAAAHATDFTLRGRLLARELVASAPDLVGLQEVALWRQGPLDLEHVGRPDATDVVWDFLEILLTELAAAGAPYEVAAAFPGADVEAPAFTGSVLDATAAGRDVRMTMSDVVLVRSGAGIRVLERGHRAYETRLVVDVAGLPFAFAHGLAWADVEHGTDRLRFVTTHLDSESPQVALAQTGELVDVAGNGDMAVVVVGDFNSDPDDPRTRGPYDRMVAEGFTDAAAALGAAGPTFGFGAELRDRDASGFSQRIDFVFTGRAGPTPVSAARTGVCAPDRDHTTGLWPSDHAGVVATVR